MPTLRRTAEQCRKCPNMKKCNNKRLEACALAELPEQSSIDLTAPITGSAIGQLIRPITPITIKQGEYGDINTSLEEINEKIAKALSINACYFR
jgi:hypothetical protein